MGAVQLCPKCRAILDPGTRRCPYCGTSQSPVLAPSASQDAAATARVGMWIIALNAALYVAMILVDPARVDAEGVHVDPSPEITRVFGLSDPYLIAHCGQYWRLLTAVFLHLSLLHLVLNCVSIFILTSIAAATFGADRTTCIYLVSGVLGALASHLAGFAGAGASGAVCGLIGALALYGHRRRDLVLRRHMLGWAGLLLVWGLAMPGIDNVAHAAGFGAGAALGWLGAAVRARGSSGDRLWRIAAWGLSAAAVATAAIFLLPFVLRSGERREIELFRDEADRVIRAIEGGKGPLPETLRDGPEGSEPVRDAARAALAAARAGSASTGRALRELQFRLAEWEARVRCTHAVYRREP